jgi:hypothetical protein
VGAWINTADLWKSLVDSRRQKFAYRGCSIWTGCLRESFNHVKQFLVPLLHVFLNICNIYHHIERFDLYWILKWDVVASESRLTWKKSIPCCNPFLHSLSSLLISPWRKNFLTLLSLCWASTKVCILRRVLKSRGQNQLVTPQIQQRYSVNIPMYFNTLGGNSPRVSDLIWTIIIALSIPWTCSIKPIQSSLCCLAV